MILKEKTPYRKAIESLPEHQASPDLWMTIEQRLKDETALARRLPQHKAKAELWQTIEASLDKKQRGMSLRVFLRWSAPAAVILLLFIPISQSDLFKKGEQLITSEETLSPVNKQMDPALDLDGDILAYCSQNPEVCESPDFNNLNNMLNQLKTEKHQLIRMSEEANDPSIHNYINKVNTNIVQVQRKLLSMF